MTDITPKTSVHLPLTAFIATVVSIVVWTTYYTWILNENTKAHATFYSRIELMENQEWSEASKLKEIIEELVYLRNEISEIKTILIKHK